MAPINAATILVLVHIIRPVVPCPCKRPKGRTVQDECNAFTPNDDIGREVDVRCERRNKQREYDINVVVTPRWIQALQALRS